MKIKNITGTKDNTCKCISWLEHWKNYGGKTIPGYCAVENCKEKPEVGAHVQKDNSIDASWYIVPFCQTHNKETGKSIDIRDNIALVSANVATTCSKK